MPHTTKYDVIIAGAGPAGSTAGYLLSKAGLKILIIDKSTFPREKLCAGLITYKTVKLLERVFGETAGSLKDKHIINYEANSYEVYAKGRLIAAKSTGFPFMFVDRDQYDHYLLKKAGRAGADIVEGDGIGIRSLDVLKNTLTTQSGRKYSADVIIGADGVNSRVRRNFLVDLFGVDDWSGNLASAHEVFLDRSEVKKNYDRPLLFFDVVDSGYAWIFPNRDRIKAGICGLNNKNNRKNMLSVFRNFLASEGLEAAAGKISSYVLPYGCFLPTPVFRNVMLVGDAAGFADPLLGEGIFYAQRSAELASRAILRSREASGDMLHSTPADIWRTIKDDYLRSLNDHIYPELIYAGKIRHVIFSYLNRFNYLPLKLLMNILGDRPVETVHGMRSYKWMKKKTTSSFSPHP